MRTNRSDTSVSAQLGHVLRELADIKHELWKLRREVFIDKEIIMSALTDLQQAMTELITEATTDLETVIGQIANTPPDDTAALQALTTQARDAITRLKNDMAPLTTPVPTPNPDSPTA